MIFFNWQLLAAKSAPLHRKPMVEKMSKRLKDLMDGANLSYEKFGAIAGVSAQAVQKWIAGGDVKEANLRRIADHFHVSPAYLRFGINAPAPNLNHAKETNAKYGAELTPAAVELARLWMMLSEDRKEYMRDLIYITAYTEDRFPFLRRGIPATPSYARFEVGCEEDLKDRVRQMNLKLD